MTLYQIDMALLACIDPATGEIDEAAWEELSLDRDVKIENTALLIKSLLAEAKMIKQEEDALAERRRRKETTVERLKENLNRSLDGQKFETSKVAISFRKSESVDIGIDAIIPSKFLTFKEPSVDKALLKKALKEGETVYGVTLLEKQNVQIK